MIEQKLFQNVGLLRITEGNKSRLFRIPKNAEEDTFTVSVFPYLPEPQSVLEVYPDAHLIATQDTLMTLDGRILRQHEHIKISVELISDKWLIIEDMQSDCDSRYRIVFWDGEEESCCFWGRYILRSEKYLAVWTAKDCLWRVYAYDQRQVLEVHNPDQNVRLKGDFLVVEGLGDYTAYTLADDNEKLSEKKCVFKHQQLIVCSSYNNFALCCNLSGAMQTYFDGQYRQYGKVESVDFFDRADIFSICRNGRYFPYTLTGEPFAENICPYGADMIAYSKEDNALLINTNSVLHLIRL